MTSLVATTSICLETNAYEQSESAEVLDLESQVGQTASDSKLEVVFFWVAPQVWNQDWKETCKLTALA